MSEENEVLRKMLDKILDNQVINGKNVRRLEDKLDALQRDLTVSLNNDHVTERYFLEMQEELRKIKGRLSS